MGRDGRTTLTARAAEAATGRLAFTRTALRSSRDRGRVANPWFFGGTLGEAAPTVGNHTRRLGLNLLGHTVYTAPGLIDSSDRVGDSKRSTVSSWDVAGALLGMLLSWVGALRIGPS